MIVLLSSIFYQVIKLSLEERKQHKIMTEKLNKLEQKLAKQAELLQKITAKRGI